MPVYRVLKVSLGVEVSACFKRPNALETFTDTALNCSFQSKEESI